MALDVFHQVLSSLLEAAGGNLRQMVSIVDVLKQEGLYGSSDAILKKLHAEGWIADAPKTDYVFVTPWGLDELRRSGAPPAAPVPAAPAPAEPAPQAAAKATAEPKNAGALREAASKARDLAALLEELATGAGGTGAQRKAKARKGLAAVSSAVDEAFE